MRIGIIGGGTIARLILDHIARGTLPGVEVVAIAGRGKGSRADALAGEFHVPFAVGLTDLLSHRPGVVVEAASHEAVAEYGEALLDRGVGLIVLSGQPALHTHSATNVRDG